MLCACSGGSSQLMRLTLGKQFLGASCIVVWRGRGRELGKQGAPSGFFYRASNKGEVRRETRAVSFVCWCYYCLSVVVVVAVVVVCSLESKKKKKKKRSGSRKGKRAANQSRDDAFSIHFFISRKKVDDERREFDD